MARLAGDLGSRHSFTGDKGAGGKGARRLLLPLLLLLMLLLAGCEVMLVFMLLLHRLLVMLPSISWDYNIVKIPRYQVKLQPKVQTKVHSRGFLREPSFDLRLTRYYQDHQHHLPGIPTRVR